MLLPLWSSEIPSGSVHMKETKFSASNGWLKKFIIGTKPQPNREEGADWEGWQVIIKPVIAEVDLDMPECFPNGQDLLLLL